MHDQDKNILKKYNILCVIVTVKKAFIEVLYSQKKRVALRTKLKTQTEDDFTFQ